MADNSELPIPPLVGQYHKPQRDAFVQALTDGHSQAQAASIAGYSGNGGNAATLVADARIQSALARELQSKGASVSEIAPRLVRGMDVMRPTYQPSTGEMVWSLDGMASARFVDMTLKVLGGYQDPTLNVNVSGAVVVVRSEESFGGDPFVRLANSTDVIDVTPTD